LISRHERERERERERGRERGKKMISKFAVKVALVCCHVEMKGCQQKVATELVCH
jgi:hypothetical protein